MVFIIIFKSYFDINGYLTNDSTNYLQCVQNLLNGNGYQVLTNSSSSGREFFAVWPVGYPTVIFTIAKISGLSPFWASKVVNIFLVAIILIIFRLLFKKDAPIYGVILLFSSYIEIFTYTWSETLFITMLLSFSSLLYLFTTNVKNTNLLYASIFISSLLLFSSRYIGAFSFGVIGLLGLYYFFIKREIKKAIILIVIAIINSIIMILYLHHNYTETGFITGMPRIASPESTLYLFVLLIKSFVSEILIPIENITSENFKLALFIFILQFSILALFVKKYYNSMIVKSTLDSKSRLFIILFSSIGLLYLFFIIIMRWLTQFDQYNYRLLGPGSFLLFIAMIYYLKHKTSLEFFTVFKKVFIGLALFSYILNISLTLWHYNETKINYAKNIDTIKNRFNAIDKESIVIFAPNHLRYLYADINIKLPYSLPYDPYKETWSDFINRIKSEKDIYLFVAEKKLDEQNYDSSVINFLNKFEKKSLTKL